MAKEKSMQKNIRQSSNGVWVGRTGGYISFGASEEECFNTLYPSKNFVPKVYISPRNLEALREFLNDEENL